jgi:hypothetical protein
MGKAIPWQTGSVNNFSNLELANGLLILTTVVSNRQRTQESGVAGFSAEAGNQTKRKRNNEYSNWSIVLSVSNSRLATLSI